MVDLPFILTEYVTGLKGGDDMVTEPPHYQLFVKSCSTCKHLWELGDRDCLVKCTKFGGYIVKYSSLCDEWEGTKW